MTVSMVAPKLSRLDLWVKALGQADPQGALELLAEPLQATTSGTPLPNVISISYGVCEATVAPTPQPAHCSTAGSRDRRAWNHDRRRGRRQRLVVVRARRAGLAADELRRAAIGIVAVDLAVGARCRRHEPDPHAGQRDRVLRRVERHPVPAALPADRGRWRWRQQIRKAALVAAGDRVAEHVPDGPRRRGLRRPEPWLRDHLLSCSPGLRPVGRPDDLVRRRHQRGHPARCRDDRAVGPAGTAIGHAQSRVRAPAAVLDPTAAPGSFLDITAGSNAVFGGVSCCTATPGSICASGLGSPLANQSPSSCIIEARVGRAGRADDDWSPTSARGALQEADDLLARRAGAV